MDRTGIPYIDKATGEPKEGNPYFFQFYKHNFKLIRSLLKENSLASQVFMFIVEHMDGNNALVISQHALSEALGYHRQSIYRAVKHLVEGKYLAVVKSGNTNIYCVNADIVWQDTHEKKTFAKFNARVYVTASEQEVGFKTDLIGHAKKIAKPGNLFNNEDAA